MRGIFAVAAGAAMLAGCIPQQLSEQAECFFIAASTSQQPYAPILLNQCTGESWLLVKTVLAEAKEPGESNTFTYRWMPISKSFFEPTLERGG